MSWSVRVQDELGKPVLPQDLDLPSRLLERLAPECILLKGIDPYADTTFNGLQARVLLEEWEALALRLTKDADREVWRKVRTYIERCLQEPHLYIKFIGE